RRERDGGEEQDEQRFEFVHGVWEKPAASPERARISGPSLPASGVGGSGGSRLSVPLTDRRGTRFQKRRARGVEELHRCRALEFVRVAVRHRDRLRDALQAAGEARRDRRIRRRRKEDECIARGLERATAGAL